MIEHLTSEQLYALVDGTVPHDQRRELEAHIAGCSVCAAELALLERIEGAARSLPLATTSAEFTASVMARIQEEPSAEKSVELTGADARSSLLKRWGPRLVGAISLIAIYVWFLLGDDRRGADAGSDSAGESALGAVADAIGNGIGALIPHITGRNGGFLLTGALVFVLLIMVDEIMKGRGFRPRS